MFFKKTVAKKSGEFVALMGVSKHTLFHYDDIGLFSPEYVAD